MTVPSGPLPRPDMRVGLLGCGAIGRVVAAALAAGEIPGTALSAVVARGAVDSFPSCALPELLAVSDLVVEAAGQQALREYGPAVLGAGVDLLVVSMGALADVSFAEDLARTGPGRVYYTSGAIGGLDLLTAARRQAPFEQVRLTTTKAPATLAQPWMDAVMRRRLRTAKRPFEVYRGSARDVPARFPKSTNVAASLALATGTWEVEVVVRADAEATLTQHVIDAQGPYGRYHLEIHNAPEETNPATSKVVPHAVLRSIATLARTGDQFL